MADQYPAILFVKLIGMVQISSTWISSRFRALTSAF